MAREYLKTIACLLRFLLVRIVQLGESCRACAEFNNAEVRLVKFSHEAVKYNVAASLQCTG